jgi:hypothetical protein
MNIKSLGSMLYSTPRTLLFFYAVLILLLSTVIFSFGFVLNIPALLITASVILLIWFVVIFISLLPRTDVILQNQMRRLKRGALIIFSALFIIGVLVAVMVGIIIPHAIQNKNTSRDLRQLLTGVQRDYGYNDGTILSKQAVENLLHGKNPYDHANIIEALLDYNGTYDRVTPLRVGSFYDVFPYPTETQLQQLWDKAVQTPSQIPPEIESRVCYPAGSFLLAAPFVFLGISDIRIVYAFFFLAGLTYAVWIIPKKKRLLFIGVALISLELWNSIFSGGEMGNLYFPFLLIAWLALNRNLWLSAICMGIAVTTKQTAWFFLPFYLILLFKTQGTKKLLAGMSVIAAIFVVTNLPFAVGDLRLWFASITSPMTDLMFPNGMGLITLVASGLVKIRSSLPFTFLETVAFIAAIVWYFKYCRRYPQTGLILAILPLFFAWRSIFPYFFYVDIIALAYIMVNDGDVLQKILSGAGAANPVITVGQSALDSRSGRE